MKLAEKKANLISKREKNKVDGIALINDVLGFLEAQKRAGVAYPLQPKQKEFSDTFVKYRLYGGAKGGGKSYAIRAEAVRQCMSAPNVKGLILRKTFPEVRKNTLTPMKMELKQKGIWHKYNGQDKTIEFSNGSTIEFSYCRNEADVLRYQGVEYDFIAIEELTHWEEDWFKTLKGCLRSPRSEITPNFFASTNPGGIGHAWVKRLWIDRNFTENESPEDYAFIGASVYDNAVLMDSQPDYEKELLDLPEHKKEAYLYGNWDVFEGQYYPEFNRVEHVVENFLPMGHAIVERLIAMDYGFSAPSAVLWLAKDTQGVIYCYREIYVTQKTYTELANLIAVHTTEKEMETLRKIVCDPAALNKKSGSNASTLKKDFTKVFKGIKIIGGENTRLDGWMNIRQHLIANMIQFTKSCKNLIRTLPELIYDKHNVEDCDTKKEDHAPDALRYGLMEISKNMQGFKGVSKINKSFVKNKPIDKNINPVLAKKRVVKARNNILKTNF